jgi:hypothetical protein
MLMEILVKDQVMHYDDCVLITDFEGIEGFPYILEQKVRDCSATKIYLLVVVGIFTHYQILHHERVNTAPA